LFQIFAECRDGGESAPWRLWLRAQASYLQGDIPTALEALDTLTKALPAAVDSTESLPPSPCAPPPAAVLAQAVARLRRVSELKDAGNGDVKAGRYAQASLILKYITCIHLKNTIIKNKNKRTRAMET
jgi:hypothetical protein